MILASLLDYFTDTLIGEYSTQSLSWQQIAFIIIWVFVLSMVILFVYKLSYQTTVYSKSFAVTLPIIAMITSVIIIAVSSNLLLSLGMVGALSIVRFRTAIKNPFDLAFMFWAVGLGVTSGAGLIPLAIASTIVIAIVILLLISMESFTSSYFLIIRANSSLMEANILAEVQKIYGKYTLRNKTIKDGKLDLTLEVRSKEDKNVLVNAIKDIDSVRTVMLLSHQGDYISE